MKKSPKENSKKTTFIKKYSKILITSAVGLSVLYIVIYFIFKGDGWFSAGNDLHKNDWLSFLGSYLSFIGTVLVSGLALLQTHYYTTLKRQEQNEYKEELFRKRLREIQPIFSVKIKSINTSIPGVADTFDPFDLSTLPKHQNFTLEIENVSLYPIKHVIIFNQYLFQLLKSNEKVKIQCAYEDSMDAKSISKELVRIDNEIAQNENGLASWFNINYEDIDGNSMFQSFELKFFQSYINSPKTYYYKLVEIEKTSEDKIDITE